MISKASKLAFAVIAALTTTANAGITSTSGAAQAISPPPSVIAGDWESDTVISVFSERQKVSLTSSVLTDISVPGTYGPDNFANTPGTLPAGTSVNTYFVHYDKVGGSDQIVDADGSVTFAEEILGLLITAKTLNATHAMLGVAGTDYPAGGLQGIELANDLNFLTLTNNRRTLQFNLAVTCCVDTIRVITAGNGNGDGDGTGNGPPLPGFFFPIGANNSCGSGLCGTGASMAMPMMLLGLGWMRRRRPRRQTAVDDRHRSCPSC